METSEIKSQLVAKGITQRSIARDLEVSEVAVSQVINRDRATPRVQTAIAAALGKDVTEVFPERLDNL
jgi:lambda repressor-like predicted transcriptional regulator